MELVFITFQQWLHQPRSSMELRHPEFLLGFHYSGMVDWIIGHMTELSLQSQLSTQLFCSFWWSAQNLSHLISQHKFRCDPTGSWIVKILLLLGKFQGCRVFLPGNRGKCHSGSLFYNCNLWLYSYFVTQYSISYHIEQFLK